MVAPGGTCESCGRDLSWCFYDGELMVRCWWCPDLFGMVLAERTREGREAEADGLPF